MATVTRANIGTLHDTLCVTVNATDYLENYSKALKNYAKSANIPGFRKGMVPAGLVKKMYGQSVFTDEVLKSVEKSLFEYLDTEKLEIFAQPMPADTNDANKLDQNNAVDYDFNFEIGLKPEINIPALSAATPTKYVVTISEEMIADEMSRLQKKHGKFTEPDAVDNEENVLNVTFTASNEAGEVVENAEGKTNSLLVKYFTKDYQTKLQGAKNGDVINVKLSDAFETKELEYILQDLKLTAADADAYYQIEITKVGLVTPAEFDEAFFQAAFPAGNVANEAEMKTAISNELSNYWNTQTTNQLQDGVYHYLVDNTNFELPINFLKKWMETGRDKAYTTEEVETEYPKFAESLKWTLISDKLNKDNGFKVERDEIKEYAKAQLMGYMGMAALDENNTWVNDYADKMMADKKFIEDTYHRVLTEKLFNWATSQVSAKEQPISVEDFSKLVSEHKH